MPLSWSMDLELTDSIYASSTSELFLTADVTTIKSIKSCRGTSADLANWQRKVANSWRSKHWLAFSSNHNMAAIESSKVLSTYLVLRNLRIPGVNSFKSSSPEFYWSCSILEHESIKNLHGTKGHKFPAYNLHPKPTSQTVDSGGNVVVGRPRLPRCRGLYLSCARPLRYTCRHQQRSPKGQYVSHHPCKLRVSAMEFATSWKSREPAVTTLRPSDDNCGQSGCRLLSSHINKAFRAISSICLLTWNMDLTTSSKATAPASFQYIIWNKSIILRQRHCWKYLLHWIRWHSYHHGRQVPQWYHPAWHFPSPQTPHEGSRIVPNLQNCTAINEQDLRQNQQTREYPCSHLHQYQMLEWKAQLHLKFPQKSCPERRRMQIVPVSIRTKRFTLMYWTHLRILTLSIFFRHFAISWQETDPLPSVSNKQNKLWSFSSLVILFRATRKANSLWSERFWNSVSCRFRQTVLPVEVVPASFVSMDR